MTDSSNKNHMPKKKWEMPDTYVIVFLVLLFVTAATYFVPAGMFDREEVDGVERVISGSFSEAAQNPAGFMDVFLAIQAGMVDSAGLIFLVLFAGGMFEVIERSGAIRAGMLSTISTMRGKEFLLIAVITILFALGGAVGALANSVIPFVAIGVMLARALRLDAIVAVAITFNAAFIGFTAGFLNPYTVGIAHNIADVPLFSGMLFRVIAFVLFVSISIWYTWRYCKKIMDDSERSLMGVLEPEADDPELDDTFTVRHKLVLGWTAAALAFFVFAVVQFQWTTDHMAAFFIIIGLVAGVIAGMNYNTLTLTFLEGCKKLVYGALIIGLARAVLVIMENANILDTLVNSLATPLEALSPVLTAIGMFVINSIFNFFIPSGSGQAAIMMPIQVPLADMIGITRQVTVLAFQFGDGLSNSIYPTSGPLMASLAVAAVPWLKWARWFLPLFLLLSLASIILLTVAVYINLGPL
ncbi:YfcC family protein [Salinicoccus halitifaciens]|uniref:Ion transporter superfamily protein YfcC n=1 Tax=Salinicoccus halitifaciens TaxID=1073415 RepID=A0ABV2EB55_9STAP|nr:Na+/H+ antiporter NhaC family protein [Salinicoccus halitifaciens]MCD2137617.1 AbgT family transporter [Salinicoccus halitifaciens]